MPLAFFITFSTYGTWLHGRAEGSVDKDLNIFGTPVLGEDSTLERGSRDAMAQPPYVLGAAERDTVCRSMVALAAERGWRLLAAHVRTNHVHVVIAADRDPGRIMSDLKARASRELTRTGFGAAERRRWTRHGSTLHLFKEEIVSAKIRYTLDEQGERMACYADDPQWLEAGTPSPKEHNEPRTQ